MAKPDLPPSEPFGQSGGANPPGWAKAPGLAQFGGLPPGQGGTMPDNSFQNFQDNTNFLRQLHDVNYPEPNTGVHVPVWLAPNLANDVLARYGQSGHAIPHPMIDINDLTK